MFRKTSSTAAWAGILGFILAFAFSLPAAKLPAQNSDRKKIAEGEYLTYDGRGDNNEKLHETWVLWRIGDGRYVVESDFQFDGVDDRKNDHLHQSILLSNDFRPLTIKMSSVTPEVKNDINIELLPDEVRVTDRNGKSKLRVPFRYNIYDPMTPWSLSSFARNVRRFKSTSYHAPVFVAMDENGPDKPTAIAMYWGRVFFVGVDQVEVAGQKVLAGKYLVHLGPYPGVFIWLAEDGLVLAVQDEEIPEQRTGLVKFRRYEELPKIQKLQ